MTLFMKHSSKHSSSRVQAKRPGEPCHVQDTTREIKVIFHPMFSCILSLKMVKV